MTKLLVALLCVLSANLVFSVPPFAAMTENDEDVVNAMDDMNMYGLLVPIASEDIIIEPDSSERGKIAFEDPQALDKRSWARNAWTKMSRRGHRKRKLSAGEWVSILQGIAHNKGIFVKGKLKGVRFGISRK